MTGRWFSPGTPVSSTNKTDCHDITEILLKIALTLTSLEFKINFKKVQQILYILHKMRNMVNVKIISTLSFSGVDALRAAGKLGIFYYCSLKFLTNTITASLF